MPPEVVGFIGIGAMGAPMSANLARAGYRVAAYDADPARVEHEGLDRRASVEDACEAATRTVMCVVRTLPQTLEVDAGVRRRGLTLVVMSTINPTAMEGLKLASFFTAPAPTDGAAPCAHRRPSLCFSG